MVTESDADARKAKSEAAEKAKNEEATKKQKMVEDMFDNLLKRIAIMDTIVANQEKVMVKMDKCEENLGYLKNKKWVPFVQMGIVGQGGGNPGTMYEDEKKRQEALFKAEILAKAKAPTGPPPTGLKKHQAHLNKKMVGPSKSGAKAQTTIYDAATQSVKLITWDEYLKMNNVN